MLTWSRVDMMINWPTTSRHERGYGHEWTKQRKRILKRDCGICQPCFKQGHTHIGNEVDHIISKAEGKRLGWSHARIESDDNLQTICKDAHKEKTMQEQGKTLKVKQMIGVDGFPVSGE